MGKHIEDGGELARESKDMLCDYKFALRSVVVEWGPRNAAVKERAEVFLKGCEPPSKDS